MGGDFFTVPGMLSEPLRVQAGCGADCAVAGRRGFFVPRSRPRRCLRTVRITRAPLRLLSACGRAVPDGDAFSYLHPRGTARAHFHPPTRQRACAPARRLTASFPLPHFRQMHRFILRCSAPALVFGADVSCASNVSLLLMRWAPSLDPYRGAADEGTGRVSPALCLPHPWLRCAGPVCRVHMLPATMRCISSASFWR
ncbi:hypothetical protein CUR178_03741 [Leishmania enriettii]|uniref:Uncharacterized protein n=1 Tax=Leishmania enriettii TaxID=5663 RepID=A0A836H1U2_LEIEN|nr:hypothetical protein CUR178_03741 [Leishmania enriettii]